MAAIIGGAARGASKLYRGHIAAWRKPLARIKRKQCMDLAWLMGYRRGALRPLESKDTAGNIL